MTLAAFQVGGYRPFWLSTTASALAWTASTVALGWVALEVSDTPLAVGVIFAIRLAPALVLGIPFGALGDRLDRRRTLVAVNAITAIVLLSAAGLSFSGRLALPELVVLSLLLGVADTLRGTMGQSYAYDLVGPEGSTNAIALVNLGFQLVGAAGGATAGVIIEVSGVPAAFVVAAGGSAVSSLILLLVGQDRVRGSARPAPDGRRSMTLVLRNRRVALIATMVVLGEILGFSSLTVLPTLARDVLRVDAAGLGAMLAARALGGAGGGLLLAGFGLRNRGGALMLATTVLFGLGLIGLAGSGVLLVSLVFLVVVGGAASALDTLGQSLVQRSVEDHERGSAMGIWFFAIGFGPIGFIWMGAFAAAFGAPLALATSGGVLVAASLALSSLTNLRGVQ